MVDNDGLSPVVASILADARQRNSPNVPLSISPRSLADSFAAASSDGRFPIIAEIKPTSPTTDGTRETDPVSLAEEMVDGGAAALSVLTEPNHFGGSPTALTRVRDAVSVPVLRKDFVLDESHLDLVEADVILLIARFVPDLDSLVNAAQSRGFEVLVEVHNESELDTALATTAEYIGINNRDLARLEVDLSTFESLAPRVPDDQVLIAESGISSPTDVRRMRQAGADGLLIGTAIMQGDVRSATAKFTHS
jgi:indole-3-glycerol phosphate synthase